MDTWLSRESKHAEASQGGRAALNKLNSIKARLRNARSEVYCTLQVCVPFTCMALLETTARSCMLTGASCVNIAAT